MQPRTPADDSSLADVFRGFDRLGLDTEFMRERTYFAQLCLLQVSTPEDVLCLDPLAPGDFTESWTTLLDAEWVLHSGRQDIEVIYQAAGRMPAGVFDTQIAMGLLGYPPQAGYATMVKELFDKELPKSQTRADWSKRPLSEAMLRYAAEDVEFLLPAHDLLCRRLAALGRESWAEEDSRRLLDTALYDIDATAAADRLKGAGQLRGRARRAAVALAGWREQRAISSDKPRRWILQDAPLLQIAIDNPGSDRELAAIDGLPESTARRAGRDLLDILRTAESGTDDYEPPARPDDRQKALLKDMQRAVAAVAKELGVAAEIVAPRRELVGLLNGDRRGRAMTGWRQPLIADRLLNLLD